MACTSFEDSSSLQKMPTTLSTAFQGCYMLSQGIQGGYVCCLCRLFLAITAFFQCPHWKLSEQRFGLYAKPPVVGSWFITGVCIHSTWAMLHLHLRIVNSLTFFFFFNVRSMELECLYTTNLKPSLLTDCPCFFFPLSSGKTLLSSTYGHPCESASSMSYLCKM